MKTIYKYQFNIEDDVQLQMSKGAKILSVQTQNDVPCIWAEVNPLKSDEIRKFKVFGTGHQIPSDFNLFYIGTIQMRQGTLVFHVYEVLPGTLENHDEIQDAEVIEE